MPNVQYVNRLIEYHEEETIGPAVACAENQFPNKFRERRALGSQRTTLGVASETLRASTRVPDPVAGRTRGLAADVTIVCSEIGLSLGSDDDAVNHPAEVI